MVHWFVNTFQCTILGRHISLGPFLYATLISNAVLAVSHVLLQCNCFQRKGYTVRHWASIAGHAIFGLGSLLYLTHDLRNTLDYIFRNGGEYMIPLTFTMSCVSKLVSWAFQGAFYSIGFSISFKKEENSPIVDDPKRGIYRVFHVTGEEYAAENALLHPTSESTSDESEENEEDESDRLPNTSWNLS